MVKKEPLFLGIDGGATQSSLVLINKQERKILKAKGKGLNYVVTGEKGFVRNLLLLLKKIKFPKKEFQLSVACFGLAGTNSEKDRRRINLLIKQNTKKILPAPFLLLNDVEIILPSIDTNDGVAVICGTGSNFFAKKGKRTAFAGGLDFILSDEASAFDTGIRVLKAAVKSFDGRGGKTVLEKMVLKKARIRNIRRLSNLIYTEDLKNKVASFAPLLEKATKKKDRIAREILKSVVDEIVAGVSAVSKKVSLKSNFKIAFVGGIFNNKSLFENTERKIKIKFKKVEIIHVKEPEIGAAKLAKRIFSFYY